jgi:hypothetical protein
MPLFFWLHIGHQATPVLSTAGVFDSHFLAAKDTQLSQPANPLVDGRAGFLWHQLEQPAQTRFQQHQPRLFDPRPALRLRKQPCRQIDPLVGL